LIPRAYPDDASTGLIIGNGHENKRRTVQASAVPAGKEGLGGVAQRAVLRVGRKWLDDLSRDKLDHVVSDNQRYS